MNTSLRKTSIDFSHRTMTQIKAGPPKPPTAPYQPGMYFPKAAPSAISERELNEARQQVARYFRKQQTP
jgi:hypothetical protein